MWHEITYPFPNFNGATVEVWEWINIFILHFTEHVFTYPCWNSSQCMLAKGAQNNYWNDIIRTVNTCCIYLYLYLLRVTIYFFLGIIKYYLRFNSYIKGSYLPIVSATWAANNNWMVLGMSRWARDMLELISSQQICQVESSSLVV